MSCKHGNWHDCEACAEVDSVWQRLGAERAAREAAEAECARLRGEVERLAAGIAANLLTVDEIKAELRQLLASREDDRMKETPSDG